MINRTFSSVAVVIALGMLTPIQVNAFGLGKLELSSALNEPFKAIIPVTALREDEEGNLQVRLATSSEFARAGIERNYYLTKLVFNVVEHPGGAIIEISSQQPIKEPFVDFLLTATTGDGRLIREYTVLLDPPTAVFLEPIKAVTPSRVEAPAPAQQSSNNKTTYQYPDANYQAPAPTYYSGNSYGPTKRDDTLWNIAKATKPSSVSIDQMMMALLVANPNAFLRNNINNLKAGYTLTVPSLDEITKLSNRQAVARVAEQYQQWNDANKVVVATAIQPALDSTTSSDSLLEPTEQSDTTSDARLQLVVDSDDATNGNDELSPMGSDRLTKLSDQLTLAQETIEAQEQETVDFKTRMDAMEDQLDIMRRIIMVKDSDLARLQGMLGDDEKVELASDDLSAEMQNVLEESDVESSTDDLAETETAEQIIDEVESESTMDNIVDEITQDKDVDSVDSSMEDTFSLAERMVDEDAVAAAIDAARAEAEFNDSGVFVGADTSIPVEEGYALNSVSEGMKDDLSNSNEVLQAERMLDEDAVAAAAEAARAESEIQGSNIFSAEEMDTPTEELNDAIEEVLPYPELDTSEELAVEDSSPLGLVEKIKDFIKANKTAVLAGLGALFLGLIAWLFARRRNQDEEYEWVDTDSIEDVDASAEEVSNVDTNLASENESSETVVKPAENIDDLLNQAEMSIAYGEYEEARAVVEQARVQDPNSQAVALKLVALAYHQKQAEEFNTLVADIDLDKDSFEWKEIVVWGRELVPKNKLFEQEVTETIADELEDVADAENAEETSVEVESDADSVIEFDLEMPAADAVEEPAEENIEDKDDALSFDTDFDLENISADNEIIELDTPLAFDLETGDESVELTMDNDLLEDAAELVLEDDTTELVIEDEDGTELPELSSETDALVEINLDENDTDLIEEVADLTTETKAEEIEELDIGADDLEFDIGDFDEVDEAETKLDLAAAYVDMGDPDGAKNILNEVLQEGNDEQKSRAQDLLNNLA
ncbi:MAG: hypothetical protein COA95_07770 [Methylophaga sp.]|nr:MAG: hypothetical protein COA95_07770 [Methylophaga sp.]